MKQVDARALTTSSIQSATEGLILQKVSALLAPFNRNGVIITHNTEIIADLEIDSVAVFDLIMEVEDTYDITFPMETISEMKTVGNLVDTIKVLKNA